MTLWFDVSDLCVWKEPQLTGIQRTVTSTLGELLKIRDDVRLFRFASPRRLEAVRVDQVPALAGPNAASSKFSPPLRQRLGKHLRNWAPDEIAVALKDCIRDVEVLWNTLRNREQTADAIETLSHAPVGFNATRPFFSAGDVCVSMSATWLFAGYGELIARHKAGTPMRVVNLVYDLIAFHHPQWLSREHVQRVATWTRRQMANADLILAISKFQKAEIEAYQLSSQLPARDVLTIRLGDNLLRAGLSVRPRYVPGRPFVLCVSTIDPRKNHQCLYQVWRRLAVNHGRACPQLLLVGMAHESGLPLVRQMRNDPLTATTIVHLTDVSDEELAWYYDYCLFTVYPSFYEGWGLPIGESLAAGRYCIASNAASLTEVGGRWADYFDPIDTKHCLDLVERAIGSPEYVKSRERGIKEGFRPQTWFETASELSRIVDSLTTGAH